MRVARPASTSSSPVANGSSVPAWPTFTPFPSRRRRRATTSCDVTPAGLSTRKTPSTLTGAAASPGPPRSELLGKLLAQEGDELRELELGREAGRAAVPAAAARARDPRDVDAVVGRPQRDLARRRAVRE